LMRRIALLAIVCLAPLSATAARVTLRNGTTVNGTFISGTDRTIVFQDDAGTRRRFDTNEIRSIDFETGSSSNVFDGNRGRTDRLGAASDGRADRVGSVSDRRADRRVPAGAEVSVRTNERIEAETATTGRTYSALVEKDITGPSGDVVIPRGSEARLVVRNVEEGGRVKSGNLTLDLESITANGQSYQVSTEDVERKDDRGVGANKRTAEMVGGGAVLGTVIGAIAGGGKGAAIGAAVGAAAGAGTQILTKGDKIRVPAETVLNFRLDRPLRLRAMQ
jgi:hypothetical protein